MADILAELRERTAVTPWCSRGEAERNERAAYTISRLAGALRTLFEACKHHEPDDWQGEPAMIEADDALSLLRGDGPDA